MSDKLTNLDLLTADINGLKKIQQQLDTWTGLHLDLDPEGKHDPDINTLRKILVEAIETVNNLNYPDLFSHSVEGFHPQINQLSVFLDSSGETESVD